MLPEAASMIHDRESQGALGPRLPVAKRLSLDVARRLERCMRERARMTPDDPAQPLDDGGQEDLQVC
jgi:hypothetical protein